MRRRVKESTPDPAAARLESYNAADWTGVGCHPPCAYLEAVSEYCEKTPDVSITPFLIQVPPTPFVPRVVDGLLVDTAHGNRVI